MPAACLRRIPGVRAEPGFKESKCVHATTERGSAHKRSIVTLLVLGLVLGALVGAADAKKKKKKKVERKVEYEYTVPSPGVSGVVGACMAVLGVDGTACSDISTATTETYVKVTVTDATGQPTNFDLAQDTDPGTPALEIFASGCGATDAAVPITPGLPLRVSVSSAGGPDCPGVATTGTVEAVLTNAP